MAGYVPVRNGGFWQGGLGALRRVLVGSVRVGHGQSRRFRYVGVW
jgi:hypothetical protein